METGVPNSIICHLASKYLETILYTNPDIPREENSLNLKVCVCLCVCMQWKHIGLGMYLCALGLLIYCGYAVLDICHQRL